METYYDQIVKCPHCGTTKQLLQLSSGNTFGGTFWSDNKSDCPMLPQISFVQRCLHCGHYFYRHENVVGNVQDFEDNEYNEGWLPLEYLKEALVELHPNYPTKKSFIRSIFKSKNTAEEQNQLLLRTYILWAFNDIYGNLHVKEIPQEEWSDFIENCQAMIILGVDKIFKAELLREMGMFKDALRTIENYKSKDEDESKFVNELITRIKNQDRRVFVIEGNAERMALTLDKYIQSNDK